MSHPNTKPEGRIELPAYTLRMCCSTTELLRHKSVKPYHKKKNCAISRVGYTTIMQLILAYFRWHFDTGFRELYEFWTNLIWFGYHFFSMPLLLKTLVRPLYRIHEQAPPGTGLNVELFFENVAVNMIARVVGFFLRSFLIIVGVLYQACIIILGPILFIIWFFLPVLPVIFIFMGIQLLL